MSVPVSPIIEFKPNETIYAQDFNALQQALLKILQEHNHASGQTIHLTINTKNQEKKLETKIAPLPFAFHTEILADFFRDAKQDSGDYYTYTANIENILNIKTKEEISVVPFPLDLEFDLNFDLNNADQKKLRYSLQIMHDGIKINNDKINIPIQFFKKNCQYIRIGLFIIFNKKA